MKNYVVLVAVMFFFSSCVAKRYLIESQAHVAQLQTDSTHLQTTVYSLQNQVTKLSQEVAGLNIKMNDLVSQNTLLNRKTVEQQNLLNQRQQDLADQQRLLNESKKDLAEKQEKLQQVENLLSQQKEASVALRNKMAEALKGYTNNELTVHQKSGKVYVSLSENLLFPSGSAVVNQDGVLALEKLAAVLKMNPGVGIQIEGNTDSIPIRGRYQDNWDLSTARANSIVRILVDKYEVDPARVISVGHSFYDPVATNETPEGRALNRRTDIVLSPDLEELFKLLENY